MVGFLGVASREDQSPQNRVAVMIRNATVFQTETLRSSSAKRSIKAGVVTLKP